MTDITIWLKQKIYNLTLMSLHSIDEEFGNKPLMTPEDEEEINNEKLPNLPILRCENTVLFPGVVLPIRPVGINLLN